MDVFIHRIASSQAGTSRTRNRELLVVTGAIPQQNKHAEPRSHINPATRFSKHKTRTIDMMDPDDWWGTTTTAQPRVSDSASTSDTNHHHHEAVFETVSGGARRYYYHEYHYIHYTSQRMGSSSRGGGRSSRMHGTGNGQGGGLEAARLAFAKAKESTDSSTIAHQIQQVAMYCNSDVVAFAVAVGAISSQDCSMMMETVSRKRIEKRARRCIAMAFHPDLVVHHGDVRGVATLGHCILQEMNSMGVVN
jgi:hypothetical protein